MPDTLDAAAANRMYWESDASVADVAGRFDLSRRALYQTIQPYPAGSDCAECGGELVFENRLARQRRTARCQACSTIHEVAAPGPADFDVDSNVTRFPYPDATSLDSRADARGGELRQRAVLLSGAAIAGIAIGTVATWLARRRD